MNLCHFRPPLSDSSRFTNPPGTSPPKIDRIRPAESARYKHALIDFMLDCLTGADKTGKLALNWST